MLIKLTATATTIQGHNFDKRSDYKTVTAMLKSALGMAS
jgi:hypothetical protein